MLAVLLFATFAGSARAAGNFDCDEAWSLCAEPESSIGYDGEYTGHDEPSLLFYSSTPGSGNSNIYQMTLPDESRVMPNQAGTGGTWNFQLHPAFWYGMALCDNQSAPEFTHEPCVPDSDSNIADGSDPTAARLHRQAHGHRVPRAAVLPTRLGALAAGHQLRRAQVVRRHGDLQPEQRLQQRRPEQLRLSRDRGHRAGELRVHHAVGNASCASEPARGDGRHVHAALVVRPVHERRRQAAHRHPRLGRRPRHGHPRPDDAVRPAR